MNLRRRIYHKCVSTKIWTLTGLALCTCYNVFVISLTANILWITIVNSGKFISISHTSSWKNTYRGAAGICPSYAKPSHFNDHMPWLLLDQATTSLNFIPCQLNVFTCFTGIGRCHPFQCSRHKWTPCPVGWQSSLQCRVARAADSHLESG